MNELDKIKMLVEKFPHHYSKMIKSDQLLHAYVSKLPGLELKEKIYVALNGEVPHGCKSCEKPTPFISIERGYRDYCDAKCQKDFLKIDRERNAIEKVNSFGDFKYISGYQGSHSRVKVQNKRCGCIFEVTYGNIFTNPNYCPIHGVQYRTEKLLAAMSDGLSDISKEKRKQTFENLHTLKLDRIKLENEIIATEVLSEGRDFVINFLQEMFQQYKSKTEIILMKFSKLHKMIKTHYGDRFGQKLYNYIHKIDCEQDHPKCLECNKPVNYKLTSNRYSTFCSKECKYKSPLVKDKTYQTQLEKYGGWHLSTQESKDKKYATNIERYGVPHGLQNKEILQKVWKSQYCLKSVTLPSGRVVKLMGYEPQVLNYLLTVENYEEADFEFDAIPTFRYGEKKLYFPDFYLPEHNLIIEVKSEWTLQNSVEVTAQKQAAVEAAGYKYRLIVWPIV